MFEKSVFDNEVSKIKNNFPKELQDLEQWVCYKAEPKKNPDGTPGISKLPMSGHYNQDVMNSKGKAFGWFASSTVPATWDTLDKCINQVYSIPHVEGAPYGSDGVGFVITDGFIGIDLDHVIDPESGSLSPVAKDLLEMFPETYAERSRSGTGVHILSKGRLPGNCKTRVKVGTSEIELYGESRYFVVTGDQISKSNELKFYEPEVKEMCEKYGFLKDDPEPTKTTEQPFKDESAPGEQIERTDEEIIDLLKNGRFAQKMDALFIKGDISSYVNDDSRADLALCDYIAYYTTDPEQIERIFSQSALGQRDKWINRSDYRKATISSALSGKLAGKGSYKDIKKIKPDEYTDMQMGTAFIEKYHDRLRFCPDLNRFISWDGMKWDIQTPDQAKGFFHEYVRGLRKEILIKFEPLAKRKNDLEEQKDKFLKEEKEKGTKIKELDSILDELGSLEKKMNSLESEDNRIRKYESSSRINGALDQAKAYYMIRADELDKDPYLINTKEGVYDIRTGEIKPHDPALLCSKLCGFDSTYDDDEQWNGFLNYAFCGNEEYMKYIQTVMGATIIGKVFTEGLSIAHGSGGNGKSTFFEAIHKTLGSYSTVITSDVFVQNKQINDGAELFKIKGTRMVLACELSPGTTLDVGKIKKYCSTDTVSIRGVYTNAIDVEPTYSMFITCNEIPKLPQSALDDDGTLDRLHVLPFLAENMRYDAMNISNYGEKLFQDCGYSIFNWLLAGAGRFIANGNKYDPEPAFIDRYAKDQFKMTNTLDQFLEVCTERAPGSRIKRSEFHARYSEYCLEHELPQENKSSLMRSMQKRGFPKKKLQGNYYYLHLKIADE